MDLSAYYLTAPPNIVFPVGDRAGSSPLDIERTDIEQVTERGKRWIYDQFKRRTWALTYRVTLAQLAFFRTLDAAADGQRVTFYFVPDVVTDATAVLVRKEKDFKPKEVDSVVADGNGSDTLLYDYTLLLTEEPTGAEVEA